MHRCVTETAYAVRPPRLAPASTSASARDVTAKTLQARPGSRSHNEGQLDFLFADRGAHRDPVPVGFPDMCTRPAHETGWS